MTTLTQPTSLVVASSTPREASMGRCITEIEEQISSLDFFAESTSIVSCKKLAPLILQFGDFFENWAPKNSLETVIKESWKNFVSELNQINETENPLSQKVCAFIQKMLIFQGLYRVYAIQHEIPLYKSDPNRLSPTHPCYKICLSLQPLPSFSLPPAAKSDSFPTLQLRRSPSP